MSDELMPCPFCGGEVQFGSRSADIGYYPSLITLGCCHASLRAYVSGERYAFSKDDVNKVNKHNEKLEKEIKQELADKWNTRADDWISVDTRLPDVDEAVMWWVEHGAFSGPIIEILSIVNDLDVFNRVTHWKPLPPPPKVTK